MTSGTTTASSVAEHPLDEAFGLLLGELEAAPLGVMQEFFHRWHGRMEAAEVRRLAKRVDDDGDTRRASRAAGQGGRRSRRAARAAAKRAAAVKANSELGDKLDSGELSAEQLDSIAAAMETDASAATDQELIGSVERSSVDHGRKTARDWATKAASARSVQDEHDRQQALRRVSKYKDHTTGLSVIKIAGDDTTAARLWKAFVARSKKLYDSDGGRDLAPGKHPRTYDQRLFDAAVEVLGGAALGGSAATATSGAKPVAVVNFPIDKVADADVCAELIGHGPIPDSVLAELLQSAEIWFQLTGLSGQPLWLGRDRRDATRAQLIALTLRDKGCVVCGADHHGCHVHHVTPFNSPAAGHTNVDGLALVCPDDHHHLHDNHLTLVRGDAGWAARPATADEIAPRRKGARSRESGREPPDQRRRPA